MAYFNPQQISFNPNNKIIEATGGVGRALYDMYQDNVKKSQEQARIDEYVRNNKSTAQDANDRHNANLAQQQSNAQANREQAAKFHDDDISVKNRQLAIQEKQNQALEDYKRRSLELQADSLALKRDKLNAPQYTPEDIGDIRAVLSNPELSKTLNIDGNAVQDYKDKGDLGGLISYVKGTLNAAKMQKQLTGNVGVNVNDGLKNISAGIQQKLALNTAALKQISDYEKSLAKADDSLTGIIDGTITGPLAYELGIATKEHNDATSKANATANALANLNKGNAAKTRDFFIDEISPYKVSKDKRDAKIQAYKDSIIYNLNELANTLMSAGNYKGAQEIYNKIEQITKPKNDTQEQSLDQAVRAKFSNADPQNINRENRQTTQPKQYINADDFGITFR
ncbi:MAG: hypothetical protein LUC34_01265 [Campylobacter sp.]|nr:hypothetical protein [Campylobacter sp.]